MNLLEWLAVILSYIAHIENFIQKIDDFEKNVTDHTKYAVLFVTHGKSQINLSFIYYLISFSNDCFIMCSIIIARMPVHVFGR